MHKAKEKASILWLLSKAYNKQIPKELKDPYYKNAQNEEVLKPQIIQGLSSCELYCMALSYIYEDLSYADLDHIGVIHLLIKKGVQIVEPHDIDLTETALIQNAPIRMSAHMAIIDAIMNLFAKDVLIPEKIVEVVSRFAPINADEVPLDLEEVALFWLNKSSERFRQVIEDELNNNETESINYIPCLPFIQDISELNSGCSLVALLSFYCPDYLNWREVILKEQDEMTEEESVKNLETVQYFCAKYLPYDILFIELDNFIKIKNQFRINLLTFISDLLYLFEVKPANCVRKPEYIDDLDYDFKENERINYNNELINNNNHQQQINSNDNNNLILLNHNRKKMNDLMPVDTLGNRSQQQQQHTNWTNDEDEDNLNEEIRNQQKRLRNYLKQQQHQTSNQYDSNEFYLNDNQSQTLPIDKLNNNRLNNDLKSLNLNKESSSSENEFYLVNPNVPFSTNNQLINNQQLNNHNNHHHNHNNNNNHHLNSDGSETSSTLSFAKLSKIKNNSISNNLNEIDNPSINLVYSSDQDDYLNKSNNLNMSLIKNKSQKMKRNSFILNESNHNQNNQLTESFKDQKQNYQQQQTGQEDRNEMANQLLQIHLKLEQKRKQFEFEKQQIDTFYKTQKRDISNEAFLKALKKDKIIDSSNNHSINNDLNAYEIKESLNTLRNNLPINQSKSDQYYNDIKSSIDILSSGVIDLEKDFKLIEEQKMLIKQQKDNINPLIDHESKHQQLNDGKFYLHNNLDNFDTRSLSHQKLIDNTLNEQQLLNLRRSSLQIDNNLNNKTIDNLPDDNNEKGFFIPFDTDKKPKSKPILNRKRNNNEGDIAIESVQQPHAVGFVIGHDLVNPDPKSEFAKAKKKEFIISQSMKRKAEQEEKLRIKQVEISKKSEEQRKKFEESEKRKEENRLKREAILEQHRLRKLQEEQEKEGGKLSKLENAKLGTLRNRQQQNLSSLNRSRPKTIHISSNVSSNQDQTNFTSLDFRNHNSSNKLVSDHLDAALINFPNSVLNSNFNSPFTNSLRPQSSLSTNSTAIKKLYLNSSNQKHLPSLPPFMLGSNRLHKGSGSSDGVSEIGSTYSEYTGPKLYVKPIQKSNRGIIVNAINIVLGGAVNGPTKKKVLEEINNNDSKHFLILFRGSGMQFRAIYTYNPDIEEVVKLYGTGPKIINNDMIDKFYKYNSGGKNFNEVHTKHLTVTIDAVTIHSQLWSGKKLPVVKKDNHF